MNRHHRTRPQDEHPPLVVLPHVLVRPDRPGTLTITCDGTPVCEGPIPRIQLGEALGQIIEQVASPIRVEVHEPDGAVYADIIDTPPDTTLPPTAPDRPDRPALLDVTHGGFLPGETVHLTVPITTTTADSDGHVTVDLDPRHAGRGPLIVFGASSGTTHVDDLP